MSTLEQMCQQIDDDQCTGGHFLAIFHQNLAARRIFTPENLAKFQVDSWGEKFGLMEGQVMVLNEYILSAKNSK